MMETPEELKKNYEELNIPNRSVGWYVKSHIRSNFINGEIPPCILRVPLSKAMFRVLKSCYRYSGWQLTLSEDSMELYIRSISEKDQRILKTKVFGKKGKTDNQLVIWLKETV